MSVILEQILKAERRARHLDIELLVATNKDKTPEEIATPKEMRERLQFLYKTLESPKAANEFFERIIHGNELQDINYLARGEIAAHSIGRVAIRQPSGARAGWGTGFLIAPGVLLTNHHVLPDARMADRSEVHFSHERDVYGDQLQYASFALQPDILFHGDEKLDFAVVAVAPESLNGAEPLARFGYLPLIGSTGKVADGEWLSIIQHPNGELKQLCVRENKLLQRADDVLWYTTDTVPGSSGSPVVNNDWYVVALHHSGVAEKKDGRVQTIDGRDFDPQRDDESRIKWIANEGIRASRIVDSLRQALPEHPLLKPVFDATPESAKAQMRLFLDMRTRSSANGNGSAMHVPEHSPRLPSSNLPEVPAMNAIASPRRINVALDIDAQGRVTLASQSNGHFESSLFIEKNTAKKKSAFDAPFDNDYDSRKGFDVGFLKGGKTTQVNLPTMSKGLQSKASPLLQASGNNKYVLHYHNYSLVMHARRRFAIYTAANVRFDQRFEMSRPTDVWRTDPRIDPDHQVTNFYYRGNQFDRGHLTRREDLEFGTTPVIALQSAADTCHWTNCTPQHERFNQDKALWQGIERYLLEERILEGEFNTQVLTGPVLEEDDPVYDEFPTIQYPVRFWKVVAALDGKGKLFATAYMLDQSEVVEKFGIEAAEVPFGAYKTYQTKIKEIERLTGLSFTYGNGAAKPLSDLDPLEKNPPKKPKKNGNGAHESAMDAAPEGYVLLQSLTDIVMPAAG
jgi:endonuclease G